MTLKYPPVNHLRLQLRNVVVTKAFKIKSFKLSLASVITNKVRAYPDVPECLIISNAHQTISTTAHIMKNFPL